MYKQFLLIFFLGHLILNAQNLLQNGDFETGKRGWSFEPGSHEQITSQSHTGSKAISLKTGGIYQDVDENIPVQGNTNYILTGYYKTKNSVDGIWLGLVYMDADWNTLYETEIALDTAKTDYTPFLLYSKAPAGSRYLSFWTWSDASGGRTFFDTLKLYPSNSVAGNHAPVITDIPDQSAETDAPISLQVSANDADNDTLIYALQNAPEGMVIDPKTGHIGGSVSNPGTYTITVVVTDEKSGVTTKRFNWTFHEAAPDPCNILKNSDFETGSMQHWDVYAEYRFDADAQHGASAIRLKSGGFDQTQKLTAENKTTLQLTGYAKTIGSINGAWVGLVFYDKDNNVVGSNEITLRPSSVYQPFIVNATVPQNADAVQAWVWMESDSGELMLDNLKIANASCFNYVIPSSLPPGGLSVSQVPQFVVIGFDDNTKSEGIQWALDLFKNKKNPDGSDARVSFYFNTKGMHEWIEDDPTALLNAIKALKNSGHEVGNHTYGHHSDIDSSDWDTFVNTIIHLNKTKWQSKIADATNDLVSLTGFTRNDIVGFRAPYLLYNQNLFEVLKTQNFLYDCSIEEGYAPQFDGTNFRWPYQLDGGSPGHNESWNNNPENPHAVSIEPVPGLWELPNPVLMIPNDSTCTRYGIPKGLWKRIKKRLPFVEDHKITGFDYNLWSGAQLTKTEVLGILKYNLDLRLQGNRSPFMFGAHTQYYTQEWAEAHSPNATYQEMREAIAEFVDYALSKSVVRIVPGNHIISWCKNPVPLQGGQ